LRVFSPVARLRIDFNLSILLLARSSRNLVAHRTKLDYPAINPSSPPIMSLSNKLSITDVDLKGKRVLIRVSPAP
jgi:hypothetical protein